MNSLALVAEGAGGWADPDSVAKYELEVHPGTEGEGFAAAGYRAIICNRPDGEADDRPCRESGELDGAV